MADTVVPCYTITKDATFEEGDGTAINPADVRVDIVDPFGTTVVSQDSNVTFGPVGYATYQYPVPCSAPKGGWQIIWYATIDGFPLEDADVFTVIGGPAAPTEGVCDSWTDSARILACGPDIEALTALDPEELYEAGLAASQVLWELSGRRYGGICTDTVRPCPRGAEFGEPLGWNTSWGWWRNGAWCGCSDGPTCGGCCGFPSQIKLGNRPIIANSVTVEIDGEPLSSDSWQIVDGAYLVRVDGEQWPCCQDMSAPVGEPNTWEVTYSFGRNPPITGVRAASALARELALECVGSNACRLPKRLSTVTRQGSTMTFVDPMEFLMTGTTGITAVDLFLSSERYGRAHRPSAFIDPQRATYVRRVTDAPGS